MSYFQIECLESYTSNPREHYGKFTMEPLSQGQGITIGNALRRTLITHIPGTAIVAVRILGIDHEFTSIPGIREDVLEIILNLKKIVFKGYIREPKIGKMRIQGPAIVTASAFELPVEVGVVDSSQYIATVCHNTIFEVEFRIESDQGYRINDKGLDHQAIDFLPIDAIFGPVVKTNYEIERESLQELILEIWTNGSISPEKALIKASDALTQLFYSLKSLEDLNICKKENISNIGIEELNLSARSYNCLKRANIHYLSDLLEYSHESLLEIKNLGKKSVEEVIEVLNKRFGINLLMCG
uniref:DNA-directed RNA polymerase subunit alpha n=1 Tax=Bulboplastis apyrenoidosa TaxID=1070855 RepID=A0A1X9PVN1_9RHOD|nr:DNA-directed RNA polymerase subunit alpha [Bulboplastis apyrenoidosa]ARO90763.1 DNA-directed RNA polymerase subunit alpha [Bulboplastis apyrenoidosa]